MVPQERAKEIDAITIRHHLQHPDRLRKLKVPVRSFDYNLTENQWIKRLFQTVIHCLQDFHQSVQNYIEWVHQEIDSITPYEFQESTARVIEERKFVIILLKEYLEMVEKMKGAFQMITAAPWYEEVSPSLYSAIPHVLTSDSRYRALYQLYRELQVEEPEISLDQTFSFHWKRTDKLYEMWGIHSIPSNAHLQRNGLYSATRVVV